MEGRVGHRRSSEKLLRTLLADNLFDIGDEVSPAVAADNRLRLDRFGAEGTLSGGVGGEHGTDPPRCRRESGSGTTMEQAMQRSTGPASIIWLLTICVNDFVLMVGTAERVGR